MDKVIYTYFITVITVLLHTYQPVRAYYRCEWVITEGGSPAPGNNVTESKTRQCYYKDSDIMSSFANHCTHQQQFIRTCSDTGNWECDSFIGFCKTLIKVDHPHKENDVKSIPDTRPVLSGQTVCSPDRTHFSLQEMSLAVLVSFTAGSIVLTAIVVVVWKCRNVTWQSRQIETEIRHTEQRKATLQAITQIARVLSTSPSDSETVYYTNPAYSRSVASDIIDMISENDHIYEEVMLRRMSSCLNKNTPLSPGTSRKRSALGKSNSLNSIIEIAESLEKENSFREGIEVKCDSKGSKEEGEMIEIEAPSTSDSGYMEDINK